jgi:hypothetical protein
MHARKSSSTLYVFQGVTPYRLAMSVVLSQYVLPNAIRSRRAWRGHGWSGSTILPTSFIEVFMRVLRCTYSPSATAACQPTAPHSAESAAQCSYMQYNQLNECCVKFVVFISCVVRRLQTSSTLLCLGIRQRKISHPTCGLAEDRPQ